MDEGRGFGGIYLVHNSQHHSSVQTVNMALRLVLMTVHVVFVLSQYRKGM